MWLNNKEKQWTDEIKTEDSAALWGVWKEMGSGKGMG